MGIDWTAVLQTLIVAGVPAVAGLVEKWLKRRLRKKRIAQISRFRVGKCHDSLSDVCRVFRPALIRSILKRLENEWFGTVGTGLIREDEIKTVMAFPRAKTRNLSDAGRR